MKQLNPHIDKDGDFEVVLRKHVYTVHNCPEGFVFKNKITGEIFGSPLFLYGYLYDSKGNLLPSPEIDSIENYEVVPYDR